ncbi:hypothetical protein [Mucilaginibacter sp.]|jgi:hypothetical protein|uniref:hypothetical protein n=1 Tax=Mucilaginibacter sp. TaxID=1882438 RepID=UPI003566CA22
MITINFGATTGADLRKEMLDLLGITVGNPAVKQTKEEIDAKVHETAVLLKEAYDDTQRLEASRTEATKGEEAPKPEQPTRKRRSKAEIEAEAALAANTEAEAALAANTGTEEPPASTENVETPAAEEQTGEATITAEDLTKKCVELGRGGKRDAVLAVFESQFGGATISKKDGKPQLTAEQYPAVMEALNAIA